MIFEKLTDASLNELRELKDGIKFVMEFDLKYPEASPKNRLMKNWEKRVDDAIRVKEKIIIKKAKLG